MSVRAISLIGQHNRLPQISSQFFKVLPLYVRTFSLNCNPIVYFVINFDR